MADNDYTTYLRINELLSLQVPFSEDAPDELLFIVLHQSYELWFKVIIDEVQRATSSLWAEEPWNATSHLRRVVSIEDMLLDHLRVLESMSPENFLIFRERLAPASGFQSFQYRALEFVSGAGDQSMLSAQYFEPATLAWLIEVSRGPTLWGGFEYSLRQVLDAAEGDDVLELARQLYLEHRSPVTSSLHTVAELMMDHDERLAMWRHQHMMLAARQIGGRPGTGGSNGLAYLETTLAQRLYPVLWEVRSVL